MYLRPFLILTAEIVLSEIREQLYSFLNENKLPDHGTLSSLCEYAVSVLENENIYYRPKDKSLKSGGLLDFSSGDFAGIPVIVVPDLHARGKFLFDILECSIPGENVTVLEMLEAGRVIICCVGDIFHAEGRAKERWKEAYLDYEKFIEDDFDFETSPSMTEEMIENLSLLEMLLLLKTTFPPFFHVLKGNHENILNNGDFGNRPFRKFADEGNMVYSYLECAYDQIIPYIIDLYEKNLPVCAVFTNCVVSHAEPLRAYSREEIINYRKNPDVIFGLTWTPNDASEKKSCEKTMKNLMGRKFAHDAIWFGGHRPILGTYLLRQEGKYIQIHNPNEENIAYVLPDRKFNPETDIFNVES